MSSHQQKQPCTGPPQLHEQQVKQPPQEPCAPEPCHPKAPEPCHPKAPEPCHPKAPEPCHPKAPEPCHPKAPEPCPSTVTPELAQQKTKQK
ncbi:cornifin-B isoform X2 [Onychomys torridus]|uniref:cornifin-B isoform X2 n=1 Tax=Onychomys torridus TaxID=38674 RepID=UPI00167FD06A|nr:cornifin-B isoform X2 [Onychomys torridus]